jgi:hypothetical protein
MPLMSNVLDAALDLIRLNATKVVLCTAEPTNATEANSTYAIANSTVTWGAIAARAPNGRQITSSAVAGGTVTGTGTAAWTAYLNAGGTVLYAALDNADQAMTAGNTWSQGASTIGLPDR